MKGNPYSQYGNPLIDQGGAPSSTLPSFQDPTTPPRTTLRPGQQGQAGVKYRRFATYRKAPSRFLWLDESYPLVTENNQATALCHPSLPPAQSLISICNAVYLEGNNLSTRSLLQPEVR